MYVNSVRERERETNIYNIRTKTSFIETHELCRNSLTLIQRRKEQRFKFETRNISPVA